MNLEEKIKQQNEEFEKLDKTSYLKIVFNIENGVVSKDGWLFLDGILAAAAIKRALKDKYMLVEENQFDFVNLPLYRKDVEIDGVKIPLFYASHLKLEGRKITDKWKKRFDEINALKYCKTKTIDTQRGYFKSYNNPYTIYLIDKLEFFARGNKETVEELCKYLDGIGGLRKLGHGKVIDYKVEIIDECRINRRIPIIYADSNKIYGLGAVCPPYFKNENEMFYRVGAINESV